MLIFFNKISKFWLLGLLGLLGLFPGAVSGNCRQYSRGNLLNTVLGSNPTSGSALASTRLYTPYICMYMYVYVCIFVCICMYMYVYNCMYIHVCRCMYIHVYVCVCMYIRCIWLCISGGVNPLLISSRNVCSLCPQLYRRVSSGESCGVLRAISWPVIDLACVYEREVA